MAGSVFGEQVKTMVHIRTADVQGQPAPRLRDDQTAGVFGRLTASSARSSEPETVTLTH